MKLIKEFIKQNQDISLANFNRKLIKTKYIIKGVKIPVLRKFLKTIIKNDKLIHQFFNSDFDFFEECLLYALILNQSIIDYQYLDKYLDLIDNWAMCDILKIKNIDRSFLLKQLNSNEIYRIRFAIITMLYFDINISNTELILTIKNDDYYIKMAIAWYLTTAISLDFDKYIKYFSLEYLDKETFKMAIRKGLDSYKINKTQKDYLKGLKNEMSNY